MKKGERHFLRLKYVTRLYFTPLKLQIIYQTWNWTWCLFRSLLNEYIRVCSYIKAPSSMYNLSSSIIDGQNTASSQSRGKGFQWNSQFWGRGNTICKWSSLLLLVLFLLILHFRKWNRMRKNLLAITKKSKTNIDGGESPPCI